MTEHHDTPSKSGRLSRDSRPASVGALRDLRALVTELTERVASLEAAAGELQEGREQ